MAENMSSLDLKEAKTAQYFLLNSLGCIDFFGENRFLSEWTQYLNWFLLKKGALNQTDSFFNKIQSVGGLTPKIQGEIRNVYYRIKTEYFAGLPDCIMELNMALRLFNGYETETIARESLLYHLQNVLYHLDAKSDSILSQLKQPHSNLQDSFLNDFYSSFLKDFIIGKVKF